MDVENASQGVVLGDPNFLELPSRKLRFFLLDSQLLLFCLLLGSQQLNLALNVDRRHFSDVVDDFSVDASLLKLQLDEFPRRILKRKDKS